MLWRKAVDTFLLLQLPSAVRVDHLLNGKPCPLHMVALLTGKEKVQLSEYTENMRNAVQEACLEDYMGLPSWKLLQDAVKKCKLLWMVVACIWHDSGGVILGER